MEKELIYNRRNIETAKFLEENLRKRLERYRKFKKEEVVELGSGEGRASKIMKINRITVDIKKHKTVDVLGDAKDLGFKDKTFNLVIAQLFLDLFNEEELRKIAKEIHRITKKGGELLVVEDEINSLNGIVCELSKKLYENGFAIPIIRESKAIITSKGKIRIIEDIGFSVIREVEKINEIMNIIFEISGIDRVVNKMTIKKETEALLSLIDLITINIKRNDKDYVKSLFNIYFSKKINEQFSVLVEKNLIHIGEIHRLYAGVEARKRIKKVMGEIGMKLVDYKKENRLFEFRGLNIGFPVYYMVFKK